MHAYRRLYRSIDNRRIAGVAGGLADYLGMDATIARVIFVILLFAGPGLPLYLLLWMIAPRDTSKLYFEEEERGPGVFSIFLKALVVVAGFAIISEASEDFALAGFAMGLAIGLYFLWKNITAASENGNATEILSRSASNRKIFGVFGGLSERFGIDATLLRTAGAILMIIGVPVVFPAYLIYAMLVPQRRDLFITGRDPDDEQPDITFV